MIFEINRVKFARIENLGFHFEAQGVYVSKESTIGLSKQKLRPHTKNYSSLIILIKNVIFIVLQMAVVSGNL
jgi:hypothetical protein